MKRQGFGSVKLLKAIMYQIVNWLSLGRMPIHTP